MPAIRKIALVTLCASLLPTGVLAQGMFESRSIGALSAGAGAGTAAAVSSNKNVAGFVGANAQQISKLFQDGLAAEKKKDYPSAEAAYRLGLTSLARAGKTDSPEGLKMLDHMAQICMAQRKAGEAVRYYKTYVTINQAHHGESSPTTITAKQKLADMFVANNELNNAATYLDQAVGASEKAQPALEKKQMVSLLISYSSVLRELGRDGEADSIEARASALRDGNPSAPLGSTISDTTTKTTTTNSTTDHAASIPK